jgi:cation transport ATPase
MSVFGPWGIVLPPSVGAVLMSVSNVIVAVNAQLLRRSFSRSSIPGARRRRLYI